MHTLDVPTDEVAERLERLDTYLRTKLLPFWIENSVDEEYGGFLTYFDRDGKPTGETTKTLLCQERMIFTMASAHRAGLAGGRCLEIAQRGLQFLVDVYWDTEHGVSDWLGTDRDFWLRTCRSESHRMALGTDAARDKYAEPARYRHIYESYADFFGRLPADAAEATTAGNFKRLFRGYLAEHPEFGA